jgi:hypothetical protein
VATKLETAISDFVSKVKDDPSLGLAVRSALAELEAALKPKG